MSYLIDRQRALWMSEVVAVIKGPRRKARSRVTLRDNSLYHTLTRPKTLAQHAGDYPSSILRIARLKGGRPRGDNQ